MVMLWALEGLLGIDEWVHLCTYSERVEVGDVEDLQLGHDGFGVVAGGVLRTRRTMRFCAFISGWR